jgi:hypothetical protein
MMHETQYINGYAVTCISRTGYLGMMRDIQVFHVLGTLGLMRDMQITMLHVLGENLNIIDSACESINIVGMISSENDFGCYKTLKLNF